MIYDLLADVGGTNARFCLAGPEGPVAATVMRLRNQDHDGFGAALHRFLRARGGPRVRAACIAVAGPVLGDNARLTNRDWSFRQSEIARITGAGRVELINDLAALALSLDRTRPCRISGPAPTVPPAGGQSVVIGMGTGFNAGLSHRPFAGMPRAVLAAEFGHMALPISVAETLSAALPELTAHFRTTEDVFSGPGLERFCATVTGERMSAPEIMERIGRADGVGGAEPDASREMSAGAAAAGAVMARNRGGAGAPPVPDQDETQAQPRLLHAVNLYARALGVLTREILYAYMPDAGISLAGGAARGLLGSRARDAFLGGFLTSAPVGLNPDEVPVSLIVDDTAALWGCHAHLLNGCGENACDGLNRPA